MSWTSDNIKALTNYDGVERGVSHSLFSPDMSSTQYHKVLLDPNKLIATSMMLVIFV